MSTLKLQILLGAVDKLTAPLKAVTGQSRITAKDLADTKAKVRDLEKQSGQIDGYRTLGKQIGATRAELASAQQTAQRMARELSATANPTKAMTRDLERAKAAVRDLTSKEQEMVSRHGAMKAAMLQAGINTKQLSQHQRQLKTDLAATTAQLEQQRSKLTQVAAQQQRLAKVKANYDKTMSMRGTLAGYGAAGMATGAAAIYKGTNVASKAMGFDVDMSKVQALTRLDKGSGELAALRAQARELGANTAFTAGEAAQGQGFLAMAGFAPKAILDAMPGILDIAKAGGVEIAAAADIGSNILTGFKLPANQMNRLGDVMVGTFTRANVDLQMLGETMKYVGPVAAGLGVDLETASAMAGKLGDAGIQGSMGGTAMRAILGRLASPPKAAHDALAALNVKTADAAGNLRSLPEILDELYKKTSKMGDTTRAGYFKAIAGEEAFAALTVLTEQAGTGKLQELIATLKQAQGESSKVAKVMADNAIGDLDNLTSAWDDVGIQMMETENGPMRGIIQRVTEIIQVTGDWMRANPELTSTLTRIAAITAVTAAVGGGLLLVLAGMLGPIAAVKMGLGMMVTMGGPLLGLLNGLTLGVLKLGVAMLTTPLGWIIMGIAAIAAGAFLLYQNWSGVKEWFVGIWEQCKPPMAAFWEFLKAAFAFSPLGLLTQNWSAIWAFFDTLPAGAAAKGQAIIDGLIGGISAKWQELKAKLAELTSYLPDWMKGGSELKATVNQSAQLAGGYHTTAPAMAGASGYGPTMYQPPKLAQAQAKGGSTHISAPISIVQQPGQSATDVAQEISRELDRRERQASARTRASLRDTN
ncbi:phage tail tape measure protein [Aeromonas veronii]|uniref:phage tail tape measure protein n=1 Tax=Aeromonas veronii TaxID=654 RepID=UPI00191F4565|nr:phage tail tape measure protein [Aeromonas veronii]MBL0441884.1 phage tail tape measure protein [Aeromonas veronii]